MEVKWNRQTLLGLANFLRNLERETMVLILVGLLTTPLVIRSIFILGIAIICQMFLVGFMAGAILLLVSLLYWRLYMVGSQQKKLAVVGGDAGTLCDGARCTIFDVVLSILFQAGIRFPAWFWNGIMTTIDPKRSEWRSFLLNAHRYAESRGSLYSPPTVEELALISGDRMTLSSDDEIEEVHTSFFRRLSPLPDFLSLTTASTAASGPGAPRQRRRSTKANRRVVGRKIVRSNPVLLDSLFNE